MCLQWGPHGGKHLYVQRDLRYGDSGTHFMLKIYCGSFRIITWRPALLSDDANVSDAV
jgi:hypothetical protein